MPSLLIQNCTISFGHSFSSTPGHLGVIHPRGFCDLMRVLKEDGNFSNVVHIPPSITMLKHLINVITLAKLHHKSEAGVARLGHQ